MSMMKANANLTLLGALVLSVFAVAAWAANPEPGDGSPGGDTSHYGQSDDPQWFMNTAQWSNSPVPRAVTSQSGVVAPSPGPRAEPPGPRPSGPLTPADVQGLVRQFQQDREAFMAKRQALEQEMKGLAEKDRQRLREQLRDQMDQWKQQQTRLREQLRAQCDRMTEQLREHSRVIERSGNATGGSSGGAGGGPRPRGR